jgi:hypothetical protein
MGKKSDNLPVGSTAVPGDLEPTRKPRSKIDIKKAIELRLKGVTLEDIGAFFGVTKQAIFKALQPYIDGDDIDLELWKSKRADILAGKQATVLQKLTPEDIEKASPRDKTIMFGVLYDKERLERGQSTSNTSLLFQVVKEACERRMNDDAEIIEAETTTQGDNT